MCQAKLPPVLMHLYLKNYECRIASNFTRICLYFLIFPSCFFAFENETTFSSYVPIFTAKSETHIHAQSRLLPLPLSLSKNESFEIGSENFKLKISEEAEVEAPLHDLTTEIMSENTHNSLTTTTANSNEVEFVSDFNASRNNGNNSANLQLNYNQWVEDWSNAVMLNFTKSTIKSGKRGTRSVCRISEFACIRGKCVSSDKYCNGVDDCGDQSDEPRPCTPCNRTYYGEWGSTYSLSLSSSTILGNGHHGQGNYFPAGSSKPTKVMPTFVCQLTFAAAGDNFGDLVQIMFDSINIGHFSSSMVDGCPEGSLQVAEISRPMTGGHWCGSGSGYSVYYSEMTAIALTLSIGGRSDASHYRNESNTSSAELQTLHKTTTVKGDKVVMASAQQPLEFDFKIRYKFIPRTLAVVRYGLLGNPIERGELVPGTYCSRVLDSCHRKRCKIQSPNYPGLYPRNVSCYFTIRQRETPPCKKVLIRIAQLKPHKVQLRSIPGRQAGIPGTTLMDSSTLQDSFLTWEDCNGDRDSLLIYDGTSTDDPVLLKLCGGAYIPPITSSRSEILIAFHSTPFGNPLDPKPPAPFPIPLRGFELEVEVVVVDSLSADYSNHHNCTFYFTSKKTQESIGTPGIFLHAQEYGGNWIAGKIGQVSSPRHTIPPKTTCRYEFHGSKHENIWIYFVSFRRVVIKDSKEIEGNCTTRLRILDGLDARNEVLLGTYCDNELPRLCDHKALQNESRLVRACTANESYISAGSRLIVEQQFLEGTALRRLNYQFNYEFVSRHAGTDGSCHRHYHSSKMKSKGMIHTSDNVFDFGRGGRANVSCNYTISLNRGESLRLTVANSSFGNRQCRTVVNPETGRYSCHYYSMISENMTSSAPIAPGKATAKGEVRLHEFIWPSVSNITAHGHCICGNGTGQNFIFLGRKVQIQLIVENMRSEDSYENFFANFNYQIISGEGCSADNHHMRTVSGFITFESSFSHGLREKPPTCANYPWLLEVSKNYSLYLRIPGFQMFERYAQNDSLGKRFPIGASVNDVTGQINNERPCPTTKNRIFIYDRENRLIHKICPSSDHQLAKKKSAQTVEIYSEDFHQFNSPLYLPLGTAFMVEFIGRELGTYNLQWLEVMSAKMKAAIQAMEKDATRIGEAARVASSGNGNGTGVPFERILFPFDDPLFKSMFENGKEESENHKNSVHLVASGPSANKSNFHYTQACQYYCPELTACINKDLWCDGIIHCPMTSADEESCDSFWQTISQLMSPAVYIPVIAAIVSAVICCLLVLSCIGIKRVIMKATRGSLKAGSSGSRTGSRRVSRDPYVDPNKYHDPVS